MADPIESVQIPNIGTEDEVEVIEVLVAGRDKVEEGQSLIVLENDKASMEIPAPFGGQVIDIKVKVGDKVTEGMEIMTMAPAASSMKAAKAKFSVSESSSAPKESLSKTPAKEKKIPAQKKESAMEEKEIEVKVPHLGVDDAVEIIEVHIEKGQRVKKDDVLIVLESDKASMEIPAPAGGSIVELKVKKGDKVKSGDAIALMTSSADLVENEMLGSSDPSVEVEAPVALSSPVREIERMASSNGLYAGPAVRKMARELGVNLIEISGTGEKGRILKEDVQSYVKAKMQGGTIQAPQVDFSAYGRVEEKPMTKIQLLTAENMHRAWMTAPHVTQFEEVDITDLEKFRQEQKSLATRKKLKLTPVPFLIKALALALKELPQFNVSIKGRTLVQKFYYHIGMAVATPHGLVVPVIRDVAKKSIWELAAETANQAEKARQRRLAVAEMQGGCITLSSLGALGGAQFTPIINVPEVSILGVSKSFHKPIYKEGKFVPRLMLPIALSYDHRAINGVDGAQFTSYMAYLLGDIRNLTL